MSSVVLSSHNRSYLVQIARRMVRPSTVVGRCANRPERHFAGLELRVLFELSREIRASRQPRCTDRRSRCARPTYAQLREGAIRTSTSHHRLAQSPDAPTLGDVAERGGDARDVLVAGEAEVDEPLAVEGAGHLLQDRGCAAGCSRSGRRRPTGCPRSAVASAAVEADRNCQRCVKARCADLTPLPTLESDAERSCAVGRSSTGTSGRHSPVVDLHESRRWLCR